jgi:hypothetical protein
MSSEPAVRPPPRLRPFTATLAVVIAAILAFALAATGSLAAAAALTAMALHLAALAGLLVDRGPDGGTGTRTFLAGMGFTASGLLAAAALARMLQPEAPTAGGAGVVATVAASALALAASALPGLRSPAGSRDPEAVADPSVILVATIGLAGAAFLGSPSLDPAAAFIVALWIGWGAIEDLRGRAR